MIFRALCYKNYILWKRNCLLSVCEVLMPIVVACLLVLMRQLIDKDVQVERQYLQANPALNYTYQFNYDSSFNVSMDATFVPCLSDGRLNGAFIGERKEDLGQYAQLFGFRFGFYIPMFYFNTRDEYLDYVRDPRYWNGKEDQLDPLCFAVEYDTNGGDHFTIHTGDQLNDRDYEQQVPQTRYENFGLLKEFPDQKSYAIYKYGGFTALQTILGQWLIQQKGAGQNFQLEMAFAPMKTPAYQSDDDFATAMGSGLSFFLLIIFLVPVIRFVWSMTEQKESKIRQAMLMMGMSEAGYQCSWFVYYGLISFMTCLILTLFGLFYFPNSNALLLFIIYFSYALAVFGLINFFQSLFSSPRNGLIVAIILYWLSSFLAVVVREPEVNSGLKYILSFLFPTTGLALVTKPIASFESSSTGVNFSNWAVKYNNYTIVGFIFIMLASGLFYYLLGWYLDNVLPHDWGVRKSVCFCVSRKYWCGSKRRRNQPRMNRGRSILGVSDEISEENQEYFEDVPAALRAQLEQGDCLSIRGLKKVYPNGKEAVRGISLDMYKGQIFALLGHNGAGKTTTISMLTGLLSASSGQAYLGDINMFEDMGALRQVMGICPQHDVLFGNLTPEEHLEFYAMIRGIPKSQRANQIKEVIVKVGLAGKNKAMAKSLSGGQKRKLSVAIALMGDSELVLLDEPTSGMDLTARRELWNMLKDEKQNRVIILTTHFMDEADILGDRIAIMADGRLVCLGSPLFLKNKFGVGYRLTISKQVSETLPELDTFIADWVPSAKKLSDISTEALYQLPLDAAPRFADFFAQLDARLDQLKVREYGVAVTTLEQVFLTVGNGNFTARERASTLKEIADEERRRRTTIKERGGVEDEDYSIADEQEKGCWNIFCGQTGAQMKKRWTSHYRNVGGLVVELLIPLVFILVGLGITLVVFYFDSPAYALTPSTELPTPQPIYFNEQAGFSGYFDNTLFEERTLDYTRQTGEWEDMKAFDDALFEIRQGLHYDVFGSVRLSLSNSAYKATVFANLKNKHTVAIYTAQLIQALVRYNTNDPNAVVTFSNEPFPVINKIKKVGGTVNGISLSFMLVIAFAIVPGTIVRELLAERRTSVYHQQLVSGMWKTAYWTGTCVVDFFRIFLISLLAVILIFVFGVDIKWAWLAVLIYPFPVQMFTYALVLVPWGDGAGMVVSYVLHIVLGALFALVVSILRIIDSTKHIGVGLMWGFRWVPPFALADGIASSSSYQFLHGEVAKSDSDYLRLDNIGGDLVFFPISFIGFLLLISAFDTIVTFCRGRSRTPERRTNDVRFNAQFPNGVDSDVSKERERMYFLTSSGSPRSSDEDVSDDVSNVLSIPNKKKQKKTKNGQNGDPYESLIGLSRADGMGPDTNLEVKILDLEKVYNGRLRAVRFINFGLAYGECFALLGVNGAGKSSTFKVLTGETRPSGGEVKIHGFDAVAQFDSLRRFIGYCPQTDTLFPDLTVTEHLFFHAALKQIPKRLRPELVEKQLREMDLIPYRTVRSKELSGGNKRKLCVAVAMLGNPPIVLLDEPSTGIDPKARRFMWNVISRISKMRKKSAVVLTTHSMEEAEALSTNIGIMVKGQFKCLGSAQHLKSKFGNGYELDIKVKEPTGAELEHVFSEEIHRTGAVESIDEANNLLQRWGFTPRVDQHSNGIGADIKKKSASVEQLYLWGYVEHHGELLLRDLKQCFGESELVEHFFAAFKFRVKWGEKRFPIGAIFSFLEQGRKTYAIAEYSVSQTSLEQIFNTFAQEG